MGNMADSKQYQADGELTNHALLVKVMLTDLLANYEDNRDEMGPLSAEVSRRFGPDAMENSASYFTGWHYSSEDILDTAIFSPEWLERLMRNGSRDCCASVVGDPHRDHCSHKNDPPRPAHGARVRHAVTGDLGTAVGQRDNDTVGVVWDDDTTHVDTVDPSTLVTAP